MKNINSIKDEININLGSVKKTSLSIRETNRLFKRNRFLNEILKYLQTNLSEDFLKSEKLRLETIIKNKQSCFAQWCQNSGYYQSDKKAKTAFNKDLNLTYLRGQLKNINFILE